MTQACLESAHGGALVIKEYHYFTVVQHRGTVFRLVGV